MDHRAPFSTVYYFLAILLAIVAISPQPCAGFDDTTPAPALAVSGGITLAGILHPLLFTWNSQIAVAGASWMPRERVTIILHGPLNSLGVDASDLPLGVIAADEQGNLSASVSIPYDNGVMGRTARVPRPGLYQVMGVVSGSRTVAAADRINLCPATYVDKDATFDWGHERGGRDGVLPGSYKVFSPERFDPEWIATWDERPVQVYGTVAPAGPDGAHQPSRISPSDQPAGHYGHDAIFFLAPDPAYTWLTGTANYYAGEPDSAELGRIEIEWETLNKGSTSTYGEGNIGLPLWTNPTAGDRVFVVGRWILDAGHPDLGARTEIHPPRLLATMRKRPALSTRGTPASQVDVYVSGHGGGANRFPRGLSATLNQDSYGGGRIQDVLSPGDQKLYYQAGPLPTLLLSLVAQLVQQVTGQALTGPINPEAGPSAFPWGSAAPEELAINDMDYDFDVPLPLPPGGSTSVNVSMASQPQHTTAVGEVITFTNEMNGLPTIAHIHLPYKGADNGAYARTFKFSWDVATPAPKHFRVRIDRITPVDTPGVWHLWADISGQWKYLTGAASGLLTASDGKPVDIPNDALDVYLGSGDTLRVFVQGYRAACVDGLFGKLFDMTSYLAGLTFLQSCGFTDNDDLGGALLELQPQASVQGSYHVAAITDSGQSHFQVDVTVEAVP